MGRVCLRVRGAIGQGLLTQPHCPFGEEEDAAREAICRRDRLVFWARQNGLSSAAGEGSHQRAEADFDLLVDLSHDIAELEFGGVIQGDATT